MEGVWLSISNSTTAFVSSRNGFFAIFLIFLLSCSSFTSTEAHKHDARDPIGNTRIKSGWDVKNWTPVDHTEAHEHDARDPIGNITIKWDVMNWTPDGYVAVVTMYNYQRHRGIGAPGWTLGWTWARKEVIWSMMGSQTTEQGDCSKFRGNIPHSCKKNPNVVDLLPGTPYNQQIEYCCKGGVLSSWAQNSSSAISSFQLSVGSAGTTTKTVKLPSNFTLIAPGPGYYTCGASNILNPTQFISQDKRRITSALMTWNVICK